jgi:hypothetical protein
MITFALITSAIKTASNVFQKLSEKERLAALAQAQCLEDAALDLRELTDAYRSSNALEPYLVGKFAVSMAAEFPDIVNLRAQVESAVDLVLKAHSSQRPGAVPMITQDDLRNLDELAGLLKGLSRMVRTMAEASKQSGGWLN